MYVVMKMETSIMNTKMLRVAGTFLVVLVMAIGVGSAAGGEDNAPAVSEARAMEIAKQAAGEGEILQKRFKRKKYGESSYQFVIITEDERVTVEVDGDSGEVLKNDRRSVDRARVSPRNRDDNATDVATIDHEKAKELAIAKIGGGTVTDAKKEYLKGGKVVYRVNVAHEGQLYIVELDAVSGEITKAHGQRRGPRKGREYLDEPPLPSELQKDDDGE